MLSFHFNVLEVEYTLDKVKEKEDGLNPSKTIGFSGRQTIDMIFAEGKGYAYG